MATTLVFTSSEGSTYLQQNARVLPIMFIITADIAGGNATIAELKCEVAKTTPNDELCIPTWNQKSRPFHSYKYIYIEFVTYLLNEWMSF